MLYKMGEKVKAQISIGSERRMFKRDFLYPDYDTFAEVKERSRKNRLVRKRKVPNVKNRILNNQEIDVLLKDCNLNKSQTVVSEVYELLEKGSKLSEDESFIAPVNIIKKMAHRYQYQFCWKIEGTWIKDKAEYKGDGCVHGKPTDGGHVFVTAEHIIETCTVDVDGLPFVPDQDKRTKVIIPRGAVETESEFNIQVVGVEVDRWREYRRRWPKLFDCVTGFSPAVRVDNTSRVSWKKRVKAIVPIDGCGDVSDDDDVLVFRWNDDSKPEMAAPGRRLHGHSSYYSVDIDRASSSICLKKTPSVTTPQDDQDPVDKLRDAVVFLSGKRSLCNILVFIKFDPVGNDAMLLFDCVESIENRSQKLAEKYLENGFEEVLHTGLSDNQIDENTRIDVELEGGLKLLGDYEGAPLNFHLTFRRIAPSNILKIPIRPTIGKKSFITVTFSIPDVNWEYSLQFQADRNLLNAKNYIKYTRDGVEKQEFMTNIKETSKKKTFYVSNKDLKTPR